jgi:hypothetical protein
LASRHATTSVAALVTIIAAKALIVAKTASAR